MAVPPARILLTGATGFIGAHLHRHLLDLGYSVRALVRDGARAVSRLDHRCEIHEGALSDRAALSAALEGIAAVVYGAGSVRGRGYVDFAPANVTGVETLLRVMSGMDVPVVLMSSLAASRPELSAYARSKRDGETVLARLPSGRFSILRPPAVYGPGDTELRPLLDLVRRGVALRPGPRGQRLALLHVHDLCRAVAACLAQGDACRGGTFAIDDGRAGGYQWRDIAAAVADRRVLEVGVPGWLLGSVASINAGCASLLGYQPMLTPGKVRELQQPGWLCDNRAFTHASGWRPEIDLASGAAALFRQPA